MQPKRILILMVVVAALLASLSFLLPSGIAQSYVSVMHPLALLLGGILSYRVAAMYQKELRRAFLFLALFLLLYLPANINFIWSALYAWLGYGTTFIVHALQTADYAMLLITCIYTLKVVNVKRMNRMGWSFFGLMLLLCIGIVFFGFPEMINAINTSPWTAISDFVIRVVDMLVILMLVPVLLLYLQYLRSQAQESITFAFIMVGLIFSLVSTYVIQLLESIKDGQLIAMNIIAVAQYQKGSWLDAAYIFGYLVVAIGLYAHRYYDEWGFKSIERILG